MIHSARQILFPPSRRAFEQVDQGATLGRAIIFAASAGFVAGAIDWTISIFTAETSPADVVVHSMFSAIQLVVALLVTQGIIYALARAAGGQGNFERQAYLGSLYNVPLFFVDALASGLNPPLPAVATVIGIVLVFYAIVLTVPLLRAVNGTAWRVSLWLLVLIAFVGNGAGILVNGVLPH